MDRELIMVCRHSDSIAAIRINRYQDFGMVLEKICERWPTLDTDTVILNYSFQNEKELTLDNDEDLLTLFGHVEHAGLDDILVNVRDGSKDFMNDDSEFGDVLPNMSSGSKRNGVTISDDYDIVPSFCSHKKVKLLSSDWSEGIKEVGQIFQGGAAEFKIVLRKFAVERGFEYVLAKNDKERVTAHCKHRKDKGCRWNVHCRVHVGTGSFYIKEMDLEHSCRVLLRTLDNPHATAKLVADLVSTDVQAQHQTRATDVVKEIKKGYGLNIKYHQAWWGVEKARASVFGDHVRSFSSLKWYIDVAKSTNPGSRIEMECDGEKHFKRIFVAFDACIKGFNQCRPLIFLDATHLKGRHRGTIMAATGKNGNQGIYPISFAVVDSETYENWRWFLENLRSTIVPGREITFISDRHNGLIMARKQIFPESGHGYCFLHLKRNLRDQLKGGTKAHRERMVSSFVNCAYAPTREIFYEHMTALQNDGGDRVKEFLMNLNYENWSNAFFRGHRYGEMTSNVAESFNAWIGTERQLPITSLIDALRVKIMKLISDRTESARKWGSTVCPEMEKKLRAAFDESRTWTVGTASDGVYEVHAFPNVMVDIRRKICSCTKWQFTGFPCAHAVAVIYSCGEDLTQYVDPYLLTQTYRAVYSFAIQPVPYVWMPDQPIDDDIVLPPLCKKPPGRPKNKRIPSRGENVTFIRCGRCHKMGRHNRKSCKEAI